VTVSLLDHRVYGLSDVDRLLVLPPGTGRRWIDGYDRGGVHYPPVVRVERTRDEEVTWGGERVRRHDSSLKTHLLGDPRPCRSSCGEVDGRLDSRVATKARLHGPSGPATGPCPGSAPGARDHRNVLICR
jgi:hypothetical protein